MPSNLLFRGLDCFLVMFSVICTVYPLLHSPPKRQNSGYSNQDFSPASVHTLLLNYFATSFTVLLSRGTQESSSTSIAFCRKAIVAAVQGLFGKG
jgi:hypothetical protein